MLKQALPDLENSPIGDIFGVIFNFLAILPFQPAFKYPH
jgi:hypothetical protein